MHKRTVCLFNALGREKSARLIDYAKSTSLEQIEYQRAGEATNVVSHIQWRLCVSTLVVYYCLYVYYDGLGKNWL